MSAHDLRAAIVREAAADIPEGWYVNLGIGMPTGIPNHLPPGREVIFQSENGVLGCGPAPTPGEENPWLINASKQHITLLPGGSYCHHADSFAMIRGGHLDLCVLGAFQVAENGDLANWSRSATHMPQIGGAMDLVAGTRRVWITMEHTTADGRPKLLRRCTYPLTGAGVVQRVYTELAVLDVTPEGFRVLRLAPGVDLAMVQSRTEAPLLAPA